jgi:hypothetical protein
MFGQIVFLFQVLVLGSQRQGSWWKECLAVSAGAVELGRPAAAGGKVQMKRFFVDWLALGFAVVGVLLMALTLTWRINPVENSVMPRFLFNNAAGLALFWVLFVTCMPAYCVALIAVVTLLGDPGPAWMPAVPVFKIAAFVVQVVVFFLVGKAVSWCWRRWSGRRSARGDRNGSGVVS